MSSVNKLTASVVAGAICTILIWLYGAFVKDGPPMDAGIQAALQTIVTGAIVYLAPANAS